MSQTHSRCLLVTWTEYMACGVLFHPAPSLPLLHPILQSAFTFYGLSFLFSEKAGIFFLLIELKIIGWKEKHNDLGMFPFRNKNEPLS